MYNVMLDWKTNMLIRTTALATKLQCCKLQHLKWNLLLFVVSQLSPVQYLDRMALVAPQIAVQTAAFANNTTTPHFSIIVTDSFDQNVNLSFYSLTFTNLKLPETRCYSGFSSDGDQGCMIIEYYRSEFI